MEYWKKYLIHPKAGRKGEVKEGWADGQPENKNKYQMVVINYYNNNYIKLKIYESHI